MISVDDTKLRRCIIGITEDTSYEEQDFLYMLYFVV